MWPVWSANLGRMVHKSVPYSLGRMVHGPYTHLTKQLLRQLKRIPHPANSPNKNINFNLHGVKGAGPKDLTQTCDSSLYLRYSVIYKVMKNVQFCVCHYIEKLKVKLHIDTLKYKNKNSWTNAQMSLNVSFKNIYITKNVCPL